MRLTVIIIGAARSGTKLLRSLVARHPAINEVPYDINYVWRFGNERSPHDELRPDSLTDRARRRISDYIGRYGAPGGGVVEKTVSNALRVSFVDSVFPGAFYVHLIRDGRDAIASSYEQWTTHPDWRYIVKKAIRFPLLRAPGYALEYAAGLLPVQTRGIRGPVWGPRYDGIDDDLAGRSILEVCALQWARSVERARSAFDLLPGRRVLTIRYENLVHNPRRELVRVAEHIGVDPSAYDGDFSAIVDASRVGQYAMRMEHHQLQCIERTAGYELGRLGYLTPSFNNSPGL